MPESGDLVLDLGATPPRPGYLDSLEQGAWHITWSDGSTSQFSKRPANLATPAPETLAHKYASDVENFSVHFEERPAELFIVALRDAKSQQRALELQQRLQRFGLDADRVKAAWKRARPEVESHPHVVRGTKSGTYQWSDVSVDPLAWIDELKLAEVLQRLASKAEPAEAERLLLRVQACGMEGASAEDLAAAWALGLLDEPPDLSPGALSGLSEPLLGKFIERFGTSVPDDVAVEVLAVDRPSRTAKSTLSSMPPARRTELAGRLLRRLGESRSTAWRVRGPVKRGSIAPAVDRLADSTDIFSDLGTVRDALSLLVSVLVDDQRDLASVDSLQRLVAPPAVGLDLLREAFDEDLVRQLVESLNVLPLERDGLRFRLLTALLTTPHESFLKEGRTWQGVDTELIADLIRTAHPLMGPLTDEGAGPSVARTTVIGAVESISGPEGLGAVLAWPAGMRALAPVDTFRSRLIEVRQANTDVNELLTTDDVEEERRKASEVRADLQGALAAAEGERRRLVSELDEATTRADWAERQIREHHMDSSEVFSSQARQAKIDGIGALVKVLDDLIVLAGSEAGASGPSMIAWRRALVVAAEAGVSSIGSPGETLELDPDTTESVEPLAGSAGIVVRPGYEWLHGGDRTILRKALIAPR